LSDLLRQNRKSLASSSDVICACDSCLRVVSSMSHTNGERRYSTELIIRSTKFNRGYRLGRESANGAPEDLKLEELDGGRTVGNWRKRPILPAHRIKRSESVDLAVMTRRTEPVTRDETRRPEVHTEDYIRKLRSAFRVQTGHPKGLQCKLKPGASLNSQWTPLSKPTPPSRGCSSESPGPGIGNSVKTRWSASVPRMYYPCAAKAALGRIRPKERTKEESCWRTGRPGN